MPEDFTLSNTRQFYSSQGDPLGVKGLLANEILRLTQGTKETHLNLPFGQPLSPKTSAKKSFLVAF